MVRKMGREEGELRRVPATRRRRLRMLLGETRSALARRAETRAARRALTELSRDLEAQFRQEESLYYPTLLALRPRFKRPLQDLVESHRSFRSRVDALASALEAEAFGEAGCQFEELVESVDRHERAQNELLEHLEREVRETNS